MANATAGADAVEIKVSVVEKKATEKEFGLRRSEGQHREVYFFDTPRIELFGKGVVLRARKVENAKDDSTVKIRPVEPDEISEKWRGMHGFKIEADGIGARMIRSASFSVAQSRGEIDEVRCRRRPIERLFSADQEEFLSELGADKIDLENLEILGPVDAMRWQLKHPGLPYQLTIEDWRLPGGLSLIEVSIKAESAQAAAAAAAFTGFLAELGLKPESSQTAKTRAVLEAFSKFRKAG
jgi:hypothetical protein